MTRWFAYLILMLSLAGCASTPPAVQVQQLNPVAALPFELDGRIALRYQDQSSTAGLHWSHSVAQDVVTLSSPLGSTLAVLTRNKDGVSLIDSEQRMHQAQDSRELTEKLLGVKLPLDYLAYWVLGQAVPNVTYQTEMDAAATLARLQQAGWVINYQRWQMLGDLNVPNKLMVVGEGSELRMVITQWKIEQAGVWKQ
ncbi:MAG: lipoprotein insertase outer membrane protein LolB [Sulfuriferula sp.]